MVHAFVRSIVGPAKRQRHRLQVRQQPLIVGRVERCEQMRCFTAREDDSSRGTSHRACGCRTKLRNGPIDKSTKFSQGVDQQGAGRHGQSGVAGLDRGIGLDCDIDQPPLLCGKMRQVLQQGFRLFAEQELRGAPKCGDGMRDRIVEAPVEGAKLVRGDVRLLFDHQIGNRLADVAVAVDHLDDTNLPTVFFLQRAISSSRWVVTNSWSMP